MIKELIKRWLGIDENDGILIKMTERIRALESEVKILKGEGTYLGADIGFRDATGVVVFKKRKGTADMVACYNFPRELGFREVNDAIYHIARKYGVERDRVFVDDPQHKAVLNKRME